MSEEATCTTNVYRKAVMPHFFSLDLVSHENVINTFILLYLYNILNPVYLTLYPK